ncbi:MAG: Holliday junction resolvase RuvX [Oscillospiraceae bacterium]|jgi:putative Holliday junction resolvase|nr:Holliday junction resolvase RuvX [Oscillospiraceae bacterium]
MPFIAALDYGERHIGVAISDASGTIASPLTTLPHKNWAQDILAISNSLAPYPVSLVVIGEPLNTDGSAGPQTLITRAFGQQLEKSGFSVAYCDERYSSIQAAETLRSLGCRPENIKRRIDQTAAAIILQRYLDGAG